MSLEPTSVEGRPDRLERAVANLLDNAAKFSPEGATVDVAVRDGQLSVRDRGRGIPEADLPHVFDRFYRSLDARSVPGSGLGLAIVRQVAEAHGGKVTVEAAEGGGTIFRLTLKTSARPAPPRVGPPADLLPDIQSAVRRGREPSGKILDRLHRHSTCNRIVTRARDCADRLADPLHRLLYVAGRT